LCVVNSRVIWAFVHSLHLKNIGSFSLFFIVIFNFN
jgi:hypothetical protein